MKISGRIALLAAILIALSTYVRAVTAEVAAWPGSITIATGSPGGAYYVYGQEIARILSRVLGIETNAQVTQGPGQNIVLMEKRETMLGFITSGVGLQAWNGTDWAKGIKYRSMRVIFPMYDTAFQFAAPEPLRLKSLKDLAGLQIGIGPRAGTGGTYVPEIFKALGIPAVVRFGALEQQVGQIMAGKLDGVVFAAGFPVPALSELTAAKAMDFLQPSAEEIVTIRKQMPELAPSLVPAGSYSSLVADYHTIGLYNFAIAHKDLPNELVYAIVKKVFETYERLVKALPAAKETIAANIIRNTFLPLHPGAVRYYREIGIAIPAIAIDQNN